MERSESIKEIATALAKAQGEMAGAKKDANNPHFKSKYADLSSVWEAARPALTRHGLSIVQLTIPSEKDEVMVETIVMHESGEWLSGKIAIPVDKHNAHGFGSALTYCRRYALAAAVGIAPEDDDGNAAAQAPATRGSAREVTQEAFNALSPSEQESMRSRAQTIVETYAAKGITDAVDYIHELKLDQDGKLALWFLLDSTMRSSIKREEARRSTLREAA